jgi:zinc protease
MSSTQRLPHKAAVTALALALTLGLMSSSHAAPTPLPPFPDGLPKATHFALPNGLEVILVPNANNPILELHLGFRTGSGADALSKEGTASLLGRMTTAGLGDLPEQALAKELARLGAWISADVAVESLSIGGQVPTFDNAEVLRFLDLFFRVALDNPLPDDLLEREKTLRLGALSRALDNADALAEVAATMVAQVGPAGRPGFGTFASIPTITRDDLVTFRDRVFAPKNAVLVFNQVAEAYPAVPLGGVAAAPPEDATEAAEGDDEEEDEGAE